MSTKQLLLILLWCVLLTALGTVNGILISDHYSKPCEVQQVKK